MRDHIQNRVRDRRIDEAFSGDIFESNLILSNLVRNIGLDTPSQAVVIKSI
jgi:hypothetical protein